MAAGTTRMVSFTNFQAKPVFHGTPRLEVGMKAMKVTRTTSMSATTESTLYLFPRVQPPGTKASPMRHRCQMGMEKHQYRPMTPMETTAKKATGLGAPLMLTAMSAGEVRMIPITAVRITPPTGTRLELSLDQCLWPGTAPSRLKANSMREQLVMQAIVQKN